jgi:hypothetical protein
LKRKLVKGEMAKSTIGRQKYKIEATRAKVNWVINLSADRSQIPCDFKKLNLTSLASYENDKLGLSKLAYNTFKSHIRRLSSQTGIDLDDLGEMIAQLAKPQLSNNPKRRESKKETIVNLTRRLRAKNELIQHLADDYLDLLYSYSSLLDTLRGTQIKDKTIQKTIRRHNQTIGLHLNTKNGIKNRHDNEI